jgi:hypothetical protein
MNISESSTPTSSDDGLIVGFCQIREYYTVFIIPDDCPGRNINDQVFAILAVALLASTKTPGFRRKPTGKLKFNQACQVWLSS